MTSSDAPPRSTLRLFEDVAAETVGNASRESFWIGRLLEEGEEADLRWLVAKVGEETLQSWLRERGGRQLSRRSRAFWSVVLGVEASPPPAVAEALWLL